MRGAFSLAVFLFCSLGVYGQEPLARARREIQNGDVAHAVRMLEDYRKQHPTVAEVYNLLGMAYAREGQADQAHAMFEEFAHLAPNTPEAHNNLGASYLRRGDVTRAEQSFRRALALRPDDPGTLYNLGALLNARHDYAAARPLLERALRRERSPDTVFELAVAHAGMRERKEALRLLGSMAPPAGAERVPWLRLLGTLSLDEGRLAEGADCFERVLALVPDDPIALYSLAFVRLKSNRAPEAVPLLEKSFASLPASERHLKVGALLAEHGANGEAISEFERAAAEEPSRYDAYFNLAIVRLRRKEIDGAAQAAERALALRPSAEAHNLLGDIRESQGRYGEALEHLQEAVRLESSNEQFAFDLGVELVLHHNYDAARELFVAALKRFPRSARVALGLGTAEFMGGRNAEAVQTFLKAVNLDPHYEPAYTFLGEAYTFSGDRTPEVVAKLAQIAQSHPESFTTQFYYGAALVKEMDHGGPLEQADRAREVLRRAAALRPGDAQTYYYLGEIERLRGHTAEASQLYEKAVALDPNFTGALYKLSRAYAKLGRQEDSVRLLARYREGMTREKERLYSRMSQIQTFVLEMRQKR